MTAVWRPRPPGWAWLLAHELRIGWRMSGGVRSNVLAALGVLFVVAAHVMGWAVMKNFDLDAVLERAAPAAIATSAFMLLFALSSAFGIAVHAVFTRGDLDLLLSSPVPVAQVYAARGVFVGLGAVATLALFVLPFANTAPLHGRWAPLAAYPVLGAIGLACAAMAFAGTFALVRWFGLRRARVLAQVAGAVVGAALVLLMQAHAILPRSTRESLARWSESEGIAWWISAQSPLTWPLRALMGEPVAALAFTLGGIALYVLVIRRTAASFAESAQQAAAVPAAPSGGRRLPSRGFRTGLARVIVAKELTLIARDPMLIAQTLLQVVYLLPLFLILVRKAQPPAVLAAGLVMLAMSIAGSLAWMTVSGEESSDLLGSAPIPLERVRWLKALAAVIPVAVLVAPFVAWLAFESARSAVVLVACLAGGLASSVVVQVWTAMPNARRDLRMRYKQNFLVNMAELLSAAGWATVCYLAITGAAGAAWAIPLALASPAVAWISARRRRD